MRGGELKEVKEVKEVKDRKKGRRGEREKGIECGRIWERGVSNGVDSGKRGAAVD